MLPNNNSRIPIAIVGLNFGRHIIGAELLSGAGAPYFKLAGICDADPKRLESVASGLDGVKTYTDLDQVLADPDIRAVGLYTKPSGRADLLRKIVRAGKDVMTTKPFEVDAKAALSILHEAREMGRVVHLNSPAPVLPPDLQQIIAWQAAYKLGEPVGCRADVWASYHEEADGTWLDDPEKCPVAPIFRLGIYMINDLVALFGEADAVQVFTSRLVTGRPTPDTAQLGIRFKNGGLANIFATFCVNDGDHYRNGMVVNFRNGTIYRNAGPHRECPGGGCSEMGVVIRENGERKLVAETQVPASGEYRWDMFYHAVKGDKIGAEIAPEQIVQGLKIIRAMSEAYRTGCSATVA